MIKPHGGTLVPRLVSDEDAVSLVEESRGLVRIPVNRRVMADLELLAIGAVSPSDWVSWKS